MAKMDIPAAPKQYITSYTTLKGVDFSVSPVEVDRQHSPDMLNMISDEGGNPVKRKGWRRVHDFAFYSYVEGKTVPDEYIIDIHTSKDTMYVATEHMVYKTTNGTTWEPILKRSWDMDGSNKYWVDFMFGNIRLFSYNGKVWAAGHGDITCPKKSGTGPDEIETYAIFYCPVEDIAADMLMTYATTNGVSLDYLSYSGADPRHTIPEIVTSRHPDGTGGVMLDAAAVNIATPFRIASFLGDNSSLQYNLYPTNVWTQDQYKDVIIVSVEVMDSSGEFKRLNSGWNRPTTRSVSAYDRNGYLALFTNVVSDPYITFTAAHEPVVTGQDNVRITYMPVDATLGAITYHDMVPGEFVPGAGAVERGIYNQHLASICDETVIRNYGYSNNDRVFLLADDNRVYFSAAADPSNIPDENYILVSNTSKIVGLHRFDDKLVAITGNTDEEASVYFVNGTELQDGSHTFAVKASSVTVGAIARESFVPLIDEPLFVSQTGIYCINSHYASTRLAVRNRSMYINKKLTEEPSLKYACAAEWNNYYVLAVPGGKCYVLDGRQSSRDRKNNTDYSYECYVFDNIPATTFGKLNGELYFALDYDIAEGVATLCKFNTDIDNDSAYEDDGTLSDGRLSGGNAIYAYWSSVHDHESTVTQFKTLNKKGNVLIMKPEQFMSVDVYYQIDGGEKLYIGSYSGDSLYWTPIDFSDLTFRADADTRDLYVKKKVKKYKTLRVWFENNYIDQPFGIVSFTKTYMIGNFAK